MLKMPRIAIPLLLVKLSHEYSSVNLDIHFKESLGYMEKKEYVKEKKGGIKYTSFLPN